MIRMNLTNLSVKKRRITVRNLRISCLRLKEACRIRGGMAARKM